MDKPCLVVFVDAYPYWALAGSELLKTLSVSRAMRPGFGYSINCQTELFTGKRPDDVGYWCEYSYEPDHAIVRNNALSILDSVRKFRIPNRACHRVVDKLLGKPTKDIPFSYLRYFAKSGKELFALDFPYDSILKRENVISFSYRDFPELPTPAARDSKIFDSAFWALEKVPLRGLVVALGNLDHVGHWHRPGSEPYLSTKEEIERRTLVLIESFLAKYSNGNVIVVSDHGMAPVDHAVQLGIERTFGKPKPLRYMYFVEGTILRVWSEDSTLRKELCQYVREIKNVEFIDHDERIRLGISSLVFGDIVAVTDEGWMWVPSFWGALPSKGMHGYHPRYHQQLGIFLSNTEIPYSEPVLQAVQVADIFNSAIPRSDAISPAAIATPA